MIKPWFTASVAWLAVAALAVAQGPADSSTSSGAPGAGSSSNAATSPPAPAAPPKQASEPELPKGFVPALPFCAPSPPPPAAPPTVSGIVEHESGPIAWADFDYLHWWIKNGPSPALVTTAATVPTDGTFPGALGATGTQVLFDSSNLNYHDFNGGRLTAGLWLDYDRTLGFEASGFLFEKKTVNFSAASDVNGNPLLAQPFFDVTMNAETAAFISFPTAFAGNITISSTSRMGGADANFFKPIVDVDGLRLEGLAGFRYFNLSESLLMNTTTGIAAIAGVGVPPGVQPPLFFLGTPLAFPQQLNIVDSFATRSAFYGGQIGIKGRWSFLDRWYLKGDMEVALGAVQHTVDINGSTSVLAAPGGPVTATTTGGIFAVNNIGHYDFTRFAALPSGEIKLGFDLFPNCSVEVGFGGLYLTNAVRPGSFIEHDLNPGTVPGFVSFGATPTTPATPFHLTTTTFWAEGISVGMLIAY
jgi:Putative beta barrel porin-7 (BBP7)